MESNKYALSIPLVLAFFTAFCFAGNIPEWVVNPAEDSAELIYGVGEGESLNTATKSALEYIAGKLVTSIESQLTMQTSAVNDRVDSRVQSKLRSQIGNTLISGYDIDVSDKSGKRYFVRVKVDRQKLFESNNKALQNALAFLSQYLGDNTTMSVMQVLKQERMLNKSLREAQQKAYVVQALAGSSQVAASQQKINQYQQVLTNKLNDLVVYVEASQDLQPLARQLVERLSDEGVRATTRKPSGKSPRVVLQGRFNKTVRFEQKYVVANTSIDVYDEFSNTLSSRQLRIDGQAYMSHESAITAAINKASQELAEDGVAESLGLL
ncbi:LPP20 lipoprotein [Alteromonadaceae bacterium 2753L.S.0a.02]|nr:LPP20 lipoprotein [Alteromonadaceae bacterium 2753L.S.0a.02]